MSRRIVQDEINQIKTQIKQHYPDAIIQVYPKPHPRQINIDVYTDAENAWDMQKLIDKPRMHALLNKDYLISVVPQPLKYLPPSVKAESPVEQYATKRKRRPTSLHARERRTRYRTKTNGTRIKRNKKIS